MTRTRLAAAPARPDPVSRWSATAVRLDIAPGLPVTAHLGYQPADGTPAGGIWDAGGAITHPFGSGQTISYDLARRMDGGYARTSVSDRLPVAGGAALHLSTSFESRHDAASGRTGHEATGDVAYGWHGRHWESQVDLAIRTADIGLSDGSVSFAPGAVTRHDVAIGCNATEQDAHGQTILANRLVIGRAGIDAALLAPTTAIAPWSYAYDRIAVTRTLTMRDGITLASSLCLQMAEGRLFAGERIGLGDIASSYLANGAVPPAREGIVLAQRLTSPIANLGRLTGTSILAGDMITGGVFWTYASLRQSDFGTDSTVKERQASAGIDIGTSLLSKVSFDVHVGWQRVRVADNEQDGPIGRFAVSFAF